ncbi:hypothetical protein ES703_86336 [subsurface metagenome]
MAFEGPNNPGTMLNWTIVGSRPWANVNNAKISNNVYSTSYITALAYTHYLKATNFGFSIPAGSTIDGIVVGIEYKANNPYVMDNVISLVVGGAVSGDNKKSFFSWPSSDLYRNYGASIDTWGLTLTAADINAADFGMVVQAYSTNRYIDSIASVDHIRITVYYTEPPGTNMQVNIADIFKDISEIKINIGGVWKTVTKIQINISNDWKTVFG